MSKATVRTKLHKRTLSDLREVASRLEIPGRSRRRRKKDLIDLLLNHPTASVIESLPPGKDFERRVRRHLKRALNTGKLGVRQDSAKVRFRPRYMSLHRGTRITFDVSVEISRQGQTEPYCVWIWECKDLKRRVAVNDVEEFHAKLEQVGLHRTVGTVASRTGFQKSAVAYAKSLGIGLARWRERPIPCARPIRPPKLDLAVVLRALARPRDAPHHPTTFYALSTNRRPAYVFADLVALELAGRFGLANDDELLGLIQAFGAAHAEWAVKEDRGRGHTTAAKAVDRAARRLLRAVLARQPSPLEVDLVNAETQRDWLGIRTRYEEELF